MLEDDFTYVLRKALKGHDLAPAEAAARAGLSEKDVLAFQKELQRLARSQGY